MGHLYTYQRESRSWSIFFPLLLCFFCLSNPSSRHKESSKRRRKIEEWRTRKSFVWELFWGRARRSRKIGQKREWKVLVNRDIKPFRVRVERLMSGKIIIHFQAHVEGHSTFDKYICSHVAPVVAVVSALWASKQKEEKNTLDEREKALRAWERRVVREGKKSASRIWTENVLRRFICILCSLVGSSNSRLHNVSLSNIGHSPHFPAEIFSQQREYFFSLPSPT